MKEQKQRRKEEGITLIALVVTIIILLILAGVTLTIALSENGLFSQAKRAVGEYENSVAREDKELQELTKTMENLMQENIIEPPIEPKPLVTTLTTIDNKNREAEDSLGNPVVIPGGFKFAGKEGDTVEDGIIIADDEGNEFVWIPVSNIDGSGTGKIKTKEKGDVEITLGRYKFKNQYNGTSSLLDGTQEIVQKGSESESDNDSYKFSWTLNNGNTYGDYKENTSLTRTNGGVGAKNLAEFITSVEENHGYYLARYEASFGSGTAPEGSYSGTEEKIMTNQKPYSKPSTKNSESSMSYIAGTLWNFITQGDASKVSQNMYSGADNETQYVESDLVNSYAWDTAIVYIQAMGNENYANDTSPNTSLKNTGETGDVKCNIYDMAGNVYEWTTEYSTYIGNGLNYPCAVRGGNCFYSIFYSANRYYNNTTGSYNDIGFRPLLYLK